MLCSMKKINGKKKRRFEMGSKTVFVKVGLGGCVGGMRRYSEGIRAAVVSHKKG